MTTSTGLTEKNPLVRVCSLLNKHEARYLVVGAQACILHGLVRTTEDVDILVEESEENYQRVIAALSEMQDRAAAELMPSDIRNNVAIKVADEVEVDVSRRAWVVTYTEAISSSLSTDVDGMKIPHLRFYGASRFCVGKMDEISEKINVLG